MSQAFGKVAVLMGGPSSERAVSLRSGNAILAALRRRGVDAHGLELARDLARDLERGGFERVFIAVHGRFGEDGAVQGVLDLLELPYTGSGVLASALGMDKLRCKRLWQAAGLDTPDYRIVADRDSLAAAAYAFGYPFIVKPNHEGSSIGVTRVESADDLPAALDDAQRYDREVFAERWVHGPELTAAVLGEEVLPLIRLETPRKFYDYAAKYEADSTRYLCPCGLAADVEQRLRDLAMRAFREIGAGGWGRVDMMLDDDGRALLLEVNTVPGMTDHSLVPMAAAAAGMDFDELCVRILETSRERG